MKITENSENYRIEKIGKKYTVVCRSPYGSKCIRIVNRLSSSEYNEVLNMWSGYKKTSLKLGIFKK